MNGAGVQRLAASLPVGAAGIAVIATLARIPAGAGAGRLLALAARVLGSGRFWGVVAVAMAALAILTGAAVWWMARRHGVSTDRLASALSPVVAGIGLALGALLLDPWWYRSTALLLGVLGGGLGLMASHRRVTAVLADAESAEAEDGGGGGPSPALVLAAMAVAVPVLLALPGAPWWPGLSGDEPHYLVYAHSVWNDGDLDLAADYVPDVYGAFYPAELSPHTKSGREPASRYSIHSPGLAVWLAPWYAAGREMSTAGLTALVRIAMCLWMGAFALVLYRLLHDLAGARAAVRGTAAVVLTGPLLFHAPHLFPDVPALTLSAAAWLLVRRGTGIWRAALAGVLVAALPWLGVKFFALAGALAVAGSALLWRRSGVSPDGSTDAGIAPGREATGRIVAFLGPVVLSVAAHLAFTWWLYGRLSPLALYFGAGEQKVRAPGYGQDPWSYLDRPWSIAVTAGALLLDQKEGLLFFAPHLLLAVAGFVWLWRRRRLEAVALGGILAAHWGTYALSQEVGGWSPPARPTVAVLWTLALPAGVAMALPVGGRSGRRLGRLRGALVAAAAGLTLVYLARPDLLYHGYRIEHSRLLQHLGAPGLPLWRLAPSWLAGGDGGWMVSVTWISLVVAAGWALVRWTRTSTAMGDEASSDDDSSDTGASSGRRAAAIVWIVGAALLLLHGLLVPVSALHRPRDYGPLRVWTSTIPPERVWSDPDGVWFRCHDVPWVPVSSSDPLREVEVELSSLVPMEAEVRLGGDGGEAELGPGRPAVLRLRPRGGVRWRDRWFFPLSVRAPGGSSPAVLGIDAGDRRCLGVYVRFLEAGSSSSAASGIAIVTASSGGEE